MSIQVNDFQWEPGKNDAEYIKLLKSSRDEWQKIAQKAITKLKTLSRAQEPVEPIIETHWERPSVYDEDVKVTENKCGACGAGVDKWDKFCRMCGRAVKWNDSD